MKPPRGTEPFRLRRRGQRAERANDALAGALRGRDRFDEEIILVSLVADAPGSATEIHTTGSMSLLTANRQGKSSRELVTILAWRLGHSQHHAHLRDTDGVNRPFGRRRPWKLG